VFYASLGQAVLVLIKSIIVIIQGSFSFLNNIMTYNYINVITVQKINNIYYEKS
jgi:hypothetical protein